MMVSLEALFGIHKKKTWIGDRYTVSTRIVFYKDNHNFMNVYVTEGVWHPKASDTVGENNERRRRFLSTQQQFLPLRFLSTQPHG